MGDNCKSRQSTWMPGNGCPGCNAEYFNSDPEGVHFKCGSVFTINESTRSQDCYETEISALQENMVVARALLQEILTEARDYEQREDKIVHRWPDKAQAFLDNTSTGLVAVRIEDLDWILFLQQGKMLLDQREVDMMQRLKAALQAAQKEKGNER